VTLFVQLGRHRRGCAVDLAPDFEALMDQMDVDTYDSIYWQKNGVWY
jgi:hypothetical protein